jgi:hypothetical protein
MRPWPPSPRGETKSPWSNGAPDRRALGGRRRSEGRRSTRRFRGRVRDHVGVPGQAGQPPHSRWEFSIFFFSLHIPCGMGSRGATLPLLGAHTFAIPKVLKGGDCKKLAHAVRGLAQGRRQGPQAAGWGPAATLALLCLGGFFSPPTYTLRHRSAGRHAHAASSARFRNPEKPQEPGRPWSKVRDPGLKRKTKRKKEEKRKTKRPKCEKVKYEMNKNKDKTIPSRQAGNPGVKSRPVQGQRARSRIPSHTKAGQRPRSGIPSHTKAGQRPRSGIDGTTHPTPRPATQE